MSTSNAVSEEQQIGLFTLSDPDTTPINIPLTTSIRVDHSPVIVPIVAKPHHQANEDFSASDDCPSPNSVTLSTCTDLKPMFSRRSSVFTEELPRDVELAFHRDGWSNRIITDNQGNIRYFADIPWKWTGTKLEIFKRSTDLGELEGQQTLASVSRKSLNRRVFSHLPKENQRIEIIGSRIYLGYDYYFEHEGHQYRWKERSEHCGKRRGDEVLTDTKTKEVIARFKNASLLQVWKEKNYGKLVIYNENWKCDEKLLDLAVITLVAVKQRIREKGRMRGILKVLLDAGDAAGG